MLYGINADDYRTETGEVGSGETLGKILNGFGVSALAVDRLDKASKEVFPLRNIRAGHKYTAFIHEDSLYAPHLDYLAYEISVTDYVVFGSTTTRSPCARTPRPTRCAAREKRRDQLLALGRDHGAAAALRSGRRTGGHLPVDGGFLRHPEGRRLHGDLRRAVHRRHGVGGHRAHLGREVLAGRQGVLRHPGSARAAKSSTGRRTARACASRCSRPR